MTVLIVVAHPDDEVLGCGGTVSALVDHGVEVRSCILSGKAEARVNRPEISELENDANRAHQILGMPPPILGDFPNIRMNTVAQIELVAFIEKAISESRATSIFTHHPFDLNNDHRQVSLACQAAARLFQRRPSMPALQGLYFMEILSATDWAFAGNGSEFRPDTFFEIGQQGVEKKLEALKAYRGVVRDFPHPRSEEIINGLAAYRGGQGGVKYAEAFQTAFRSLQPSDF